MLHFKVVPLQSLAEMMSPTQGINVCVLEILARGLYIRIDPRQAVSLYLMCV